MDNGETILEVRNLKKYFKNRKGLLHAVDDVSFSLRKGTTLGVVGESGCGKSTLGRAILRLHEPTSGEVIFEGKNLLQMNAAQMKQMRKEMQIIFQDPYSSLDPMHTVFQAISEPMVKFGLYPDKDTLEKKVVELMDIVGLAHRLINTYPHELDGGRRQRIGVARALALNPKFIVCDEPVSALDVSIQAQIINLLEQLQKDRGITYMFITHDLSVVRHLSNEIMVMYLGRMVEKAPADELFSNPLHPYTRALLSAIPVPDLDYKPNRIILRGEVSSPINPKDVCRFCRRCYCKSEDCSRLPEPMLREVSEGHFVACHSCK
ncbi:MAG: ATP-binding cassette domain-containing protein [Spirochaetales bacterium]|nr:ATP-binding cassette domain-containing protein [Spirochaetales bacterium]